MPAFTAIGAYVAGTLLGLAGTAALIVGAVVATGAAYITSRIINGNPNKGNNSASNQGGRIQVPPATNNKIPVVYGSAYVNGIITDARLKSLGGTTNDTMYYCLVLSEYTNNLTVNAGNFIVGQKYTISVIGTTNFTLIGAASNTVGVTFTATGVGTGTGQARYNSVYGLESVLWNDLRLTAVDTTTNAHKVKDGRKVVDGAIVNAGSFVVGSTYVITEIGNTNFTAIGAQTNNIGQIFTATGVGAGSGNAQIEDFIDTNFIVDNNSLVELRVYAGGSSAAEQIYPPQSSLNTTPAYTFWGNADGSWTNQYAMDGLVFAIVKLTYNGDKGFTALPNVTFQLANNLANPADVWYDYMVSKRYGAGIPATDIDTTARGVWAEYCEEDISYTNVAGETNQSTLRYNINGVIDTSNQVKTNIDTIMQNGGAWMSYNVATGLWSPVIKKANSAGQGNDVTKQFTASRSSNVLTIPLPTIPLPNPFPSGRIETGQKLYSVGGTYIGTITGQQFPLNPGETTGQIGRYTTSSSGPIATTTFYTLPASSLEFSDDNIISGITISSTRLEDLYNKVEAEFYNRYNKDQRAYARNDLPTIQRNPNEPDNQLRLSLDLVNNSMQADILGQLEMRQSRDDLVIEFTTTHYGIQAQAGDIVAVTSELYDWAPKYFRVMRVKEIENEDATLTAQIQALEYNPDVYTIEPITEFSTSANIGIGNLVSSKGLPKPTNPVISEENPNDGVPNFKFSIDIPATGGPFDEAEIYVAEGWDPNSVTGTIVPGTGSNGVVVGKGLMTVTAVTYNSINVGDYFDLGGVTVEAQLTQTTISTKTFSSGGAIGAKTFTLNNVTGVVIGQKPTGTGIPTGAMVVGVSGTTVTLDKAFTIQAAGSYLFTTAGGTGTYRVNISTTAGPATDDLFDQPIDSDFRYLKKIVPDGNAPAFTSGSTISTIITELPANSFTFRRYFLKSRLGVKKNFGEFSPNTPVDLDGNSVPWQPNPVGGGGGGGGGTPLAGVFSSVAINNTTPFLTFSNQVDGVNPMYGIRGKSSVDDPWFVGAGSVGDDQGYLEIATGDNAGDPFGVASPIYARQYNGYASGGVPWYGGSGTVVNQLTLLDDNGHTIIPNNLTVDTNTLFVNATTNRVGIRKTPDVELDVNGAAGISGNLNVDSNTLLVDATNHRVGIKNASPSVELDVTGATKISGNLTVDTNTLFVDATNNKVGIKNTSPTVELDVTGAANITSNLSVDTDTLFVNATTHKVGVNMTNPIYTLDVNGDAHVQLDAVINGDLFVLGTTSAGMVADIITFNTSGAIFNTDTITLDIGGAASTFNLGANSGTMTIGNPTVRGTQTTQNLYNTVAQTLNIGGESIATNIGAGTGTTTIGNDLAVKGTNLILNSDGVGAEDITILFERGASDARIKWNETTERFEFNKPLTTEINNGIRVSQDLFGTGYHGAVIAGTTGSIFTGGDYYFQRNGGTYPSNDASIIVDRAASATDSYITWDESDVRWNISNDTNVVGNLILTGNTIKKSGGTTVVTFSGTNLTTVAGDIAVGGNTIRDSASTAAIELSGANVTVEGTLEVNGNQILSSTGVTAITLSNNDVTIADNLTVSGLIITPTVSNTLTLKNTTTNDTSVITKNTDNSVQIDELFIGPVFKATQNLAANEYIDIGVSTTDNGDYAAINRYSKSTAAGTYGTASVQQQIYTRKASGGSGTVTDMMEELVGSVNVVIPSAAPIGIRSAKLIITVERNLETQIVEMLVVSDGTTINSVISSDINTGVNLATFAASITGGSPAATIFVKATATGTGNYYTIDITKYYQQTRD